MFRVGKNQCIMLPEISDAQYIVFCVNLKLAAGDQIVLDKNSVGKGDERSYSLPSSIYTTFVFTVVCVQGS